MFCFLRLNIKVLTSSGSSDVSIDLRCRTKSESFIITFEDHDGSVCYHLYLNTRIIVDLSLLCVEFLRHLWKKNLKTTRLTLQNFWCNLAHENCWGRCMDIVTLSSIWMECTMWLIHSVPRKYLPNFLQIAKMALSKDPDFVIASLKYVLEILHNPNKNQLLSL